MTDGFSPILWGLIRFNKLMLSATKTIRPARGQKRFCFWTPAGRSVYFFIISFTALSSWVSWPLMKSSGLL